MPWKAPAVSELRFALCHTVRSAGVPAALDGYRILCGRGITGPGSPRRAARRGLAVYYCAKEIRNLSHDQPRLATML